MRPSEFRDCLFVPAVAAAESVTVGNAGGSVIIHSGRPEDYGYGSGGAPFLVPEGGVVIPFGATRDFVYDPDLRAYVLADLADPDALR